MLDDSDRLKPCPFCGGDAEFNVVQGDKGDQDIGAHFIGCLKCAACTRLVSPCGDDPKTILIETWNKRALLTSDFGEDVRKFSHHMDDLATELRGILERYRCLK
jgi:Lar family restriction alleviation protein